MEAALEGEEGRKGGGTPTSRRSKFKPDFKGEHASSFFSIGVWTIARRKEFFVGDVLSFLHAGMMKFEILLSPSSHVRARRIRKVIHVGRILPETTLGRTRLRTVLGSKELGF